MYSILKPTDTLWVHDFHLFHVGQELRQFGWRGKIGFFLHVPFPPADIFAMLPWARELLQGLLHYDLVGVHTEHYVQNLTHTFESELGIKCSDGVIRQGSRSTRLGAYPIGIDPSIFHRSASLETRGLTETLSLSTSPDNRIILGVDRLDYTKGIPERLRAFERLVEQQPSLLGKVTFVQISSPSRTRVLLAPDLQREIDRILSHHL